MTSWARGHAATPEAIDHSAQVAAAVALSPDDERTRTLREAHLALDRVPEDGTQAATEQYVAARIAAGLEVGHFPADGTIHLGHFAQDCQPDDDEHQADED